MRAVCLLLPCLAPVFVAAAIANPAVAHSRATDRAASLQSHDALVAAARTTAAAHAGRTDPADLEVRAPDARLRLPACAEPLAGRVAPGTRATTQLTIEVRCPRPAWRQFLAVRVHAVEPVVVVVRPVARAQVIAATDLALAPRELGTLPGGWLRNVDEAVGRIAVRPLAAGEALAPAATRAAPVVRRGQEVTVLARTGGLEVRSRGVALGDAGLAERVRVRNPRAERVIDGVVRSAGTVEVPLE